MGPQAACRRWSEVSSVGAFDGRLGSPFHKFGHVYLEARWDDRKLWARHAVPLPFQAPNRSVGAQHAVPGYTHPNVSVCECIYEMTVLGKEEM